MSKVRLVITDELKVEINLILGALGQPPITQQEILKLNLLCFKDFDDYSLICQAIICVALLYNIRGLPCPAKDLAYLNNLSNCNDCKIDVDKIGYFNDKIYAIGGNSGIDPNWWWWRF